MASAAVQRVDDASVKAVIFDMDGVLVDSEPIHQDATRRLLARYGIEHVDVDDPALVGLTDREIFELLGSRYALPADAPRLVREFITICGELLRARATPMPGVPDVLHALRAGGYRLALASSSSREIIATTLETLGVTDLFEQVVSAVDVGRGKPAPDVFVEAARRLGVPPDACLVVEDSRNGVLAARAAGMFCVAVPCPTTRRHDFGEATAVLGALPELLGVIESPRAPARPGPFEAVVATSDVVLRTPVR